MKRLSHTSLNPLTCNASRRRTWKCSLSTRGTRRKPKPMASSGRKVPSLDSSARIMFSSGRTSSRPCAKRQKTQESLEPIRATTPISVRLRRLIATLRFWERMTRSVGGLGRQTGHHTYGRVFRVNMELVDTPFRERYRQLEIMASSSKPQSSSHLLPTHPVTSALMCAKICDELACTPMPLPQIPSGIRLEAPSGHG